MIALFLFLVFFIGFSVVILKTAVAIWPILVVSILFMLLMAIIIHPYIFLGLGIVGYIGYKSLVSQNT